MARSRATPSLLLALTALALLVVGGATRAQAPPPNAPERYRERLHVVDSLASASRLDTAIVVLQTSIRDARRRGDRRSLPFLVQVHADLIERQGGDPQSRAREALQLALAVRDTSTLMAALSLLGTRPLDHDGLQEPAVEWLLRLALDRDDRRFESIARTTMASEALAQGLPEEARKGYTRAIELSRLAGDWPSELDALSGLGRAHFAVGELDQARDCHRRVARIAGDRRAFDELGEALSDLGEIELIAGDLDVAVEEYRRSWAIYRRSGNPRDWITPALQTAIVQRYLEQVAEAETTLRHVMAACDSLRQPAFKARALAELASTEARAGKLAEAVALCRQGLGLGRTLPLEQRAELTLPLAQALAGQDSAAAGLALLDRELRTLRGRVPGAIQLDLESARAELLRALGRPREGLEAGRRAQRLARTAAAWTRVRLLIGMARCEQDLGHVDRAAVRLGEAFTDWDEDRRMPNDLDGREQRQASERMLGSALAELALTYPPQNPADQRMRAAYDTLQRFKARGLLERTLGPQQRPELPALLERAPLAAESLQRAVLAEGELLLDLWLGSPGSFLFAVTRDSLRVVRLTDDHELERRAQIFCGLIAQAPAGVDPAALDSSAARFGVSLLGDVADLARSSRRIVFSADGALVALPLGALRLPDASGRLVPLAVDHEIELVPSANWLAVARGTPAHAGTRTRVLALAGPVDESGAASGGALGEVEGVRARYQGVEVRTPDRLGAASIASERLADYDLLHLVARTRVDGQHPWYSGVLLERPSDSDHDPYLRAASIAGLRLPARLVVLSRCEPARDRALSGAGLQGLSTAFLSAGVGAVVANLWPVGDATTERLMAALYAGLASGQSAAAALRSAQQLVRDDPTTRAPFHWAGFVLIGDGGVKVALAPRPRWVWPTIAGAGVLAAALALVAGARRRRVDAEPPQNNVV